jgi:hypothetical protein
MMANQPMSPMMLPQQAQPQQYMGMQQPGQQQAPPQYMNQQQVSEKFRKIY